MFTQFNYMHYRSDTIITITPVIKLKKSGHNYSFLNRVFLKRLMAKFR